MCKHPHNRGIGLSSLPTMEGVTYRLNGVTRKTKYDFRRENLCRNCCRTAQILHSANNVSFSKSTSTFQSSKNRNYIIDQLANSHKQIQHWMKLKGASKILSHKIAIHRTWFQELSSSKHSPAKHQTQNWNGQLEIVWTKNSMRDEVLKIHVRKLIY